MATGTFPVRRLLTIPDVSSPQPGHVYRPDIDGLRAIAIVVAVAFHTQLPMFAGGFVGVELFFVISGYLIGSLVYRDVCAGKFSLLQFYARRAKRILPALLVVLFFSNVIAFALLSPLELKGYCAQAVAALTSSSNIYYWLRSNYFNPTAMFNPLLNTWTLGCEEQFYLLFPLALFLAYKFARKWLLVLVFATSFLSFAGCVFWQHMHPSAAFYLLPTRIWELGVGIFIAIYERHHDTSMVAQGKLADFLGWLGLALIAVPVLTYSDRTTFPGIAALPPTLGAACLVCSRGSFVNRRLLASKPMVFIGLVSYSWYLWHWPLMSFARIISGGLLSVPRVTLIAIFSLAIAVVSYRLIEQPFRRSTTPAPRLLANYVTVLIVMTGITFLGYLRSGWPARFPELARAERSVSQVEHNPCLVSFEESRPHLTPQCVVEGRGPTVALVGDSHAAALSPAVRALAIRDGYGFEELTKASCPPLLSVRVRWTLHPEFGPACSSFEQWVMQRVAGDDHTTVVILAGFWSAPFVDGHFSVDKSDTEKELSEAAGGDGLHWGLLSAIRLLRRAGKQVFVVSDVPRFDPDPLSNVRNAVIKRRGVVASLLSSQPFTLDAVPEERLITHEDALAESDVKQAANEGEATIINVRKNLCPSSLCRFWENGVLYYANPSHLTAAGAEYALRGQDPLSVDN